MHVMLEDARIKNIQDKKKGAALVKEQSEL